MAGENAGYILYYGLNGYGISVPYFCVTLFTFVVAVPAVLLNGIVARILFGRDFREDAACIFISHLALSDLSSGILLFYNAIYNLIHYKQYYECAVRFGLVNGVFLNSALIIFALTSERYAKIIFPYRYVTWFTPSRAKLFTILSWTISLIFCQAPLYGWNNSISEAYCRYFGVFTKDFLTIFSSVIYFAFFLLFDLSDRLETLYDASMPVVDVHILC